MLCPTSVRRYLRTVWRQAQLYFFYSSLTFTFLPYLTYCLILYFAAQLIHTPEGCQAASTAFVCPNGTAGFPPPPPPGPKCSIDGPHLVSFVFYMQSLFSAFQSLGSIYTALAQVGMGIHMGMAMGVSMRVHGHTNEH